MHLNLNAFLARRPLRIGSPSLSSPPLISLRSPSSSLRTSVSSTHTSILINHPTHLPQPSQPLLPLLLSSQHFSTYLLPIPSSLCSTPTSLPHVLPRFYLPSTICIPSPLPSQYLLSHLISQFKSGYSSPSTFPPSLLQITQYPLVLYRTIPPVVSRVSYPFPSLILLQ